MNRQEMRQFVMDMSVEDLQNLRTFVVEELKVRAERLGYKTWLIAVPAPGSGDKIACIKAIRELTGLGLREAKEAVEGVEAGKPFDLSLADVERMKDYLMTIPGVKVDTGL